MQSRQLGFMVTLATSICTSISRGGQVLLSSGFLRTSLFGDQTHVSIPN